VGRFRAVFCVVGRCVTVWFFPVCDLAAHSQRGQVQPEIKHDVSPPFRSLKPHLANRIPIVAAESEEANRGRGLFSPYFPPLAAFCIAGYNRFKLLGISISSTESSD
jgi:hypothetical protein